MEMRMREDTKQRVLAIRRYGNPTRGDVGESTAANLKYWAARASENSEQGRRARGGEMRLPNTGGPVKLKNTTGKPYRNGHVDRQMKDES
jgi:hypothetical protein